MCVRLKVEIKGSILLKDDRLKADPRMNPSESILAKAT